MVYLTQGYPVGNTHFVTIYCRFSRPLTLGNTHFVTESRRFSRPLTLSNTLVTESCSFSRPLTLSIPCSAFSFPAQMLLSMFFLLLFRLSFITCAWKEDWSTQVLSSCQWTSLIKWQGGHHHFCMTILFYCNLSIPHWATACFPPPMLTALPVTHLVDSGSISFIVYIYWSINHLVGML